MRLLIAATIVCSFCFWTLGCNKQPNVLVPAAAKKTRLQVADERHKLWGLYCDIQDMIGDIDRKRDKLRAQGVEWSEPRQLALKKEQNAIRKRLEKVGSKMAELRVLEHRLTLEEADSLE